MKIAVIVEGNTELVFRPFLIQFLRKHLETKGSTNIMPRLDFVPQRGRLPTHDALRRLVSDLLNKRPAPADYVIALTDVYTGQNPPEFRDAAEAKRKMRDWVGDEQRFFPHAAQHDFEAWLLPYWSTIQQLAGSKRQPPTAKPEEVDHGTPPAHVLNTLFVTGLVRKGYVKGRDAARILRDQDLMVAIRQCPELKAFVNTILAACGACKLP